MRCVRIVAAIVVGLMAQSPANAASPNGISVLSAVYGISDSAHKIDIAARLQDLCGGGGDTCDVWCSQDTFGGPKQGGHAVCRVIYRCPDGATRSTEAAHDEPILMRCAAAEADDRTTAPAN